MRELATEMVATVVLCRMYNEDVVNVHQEEVKPDDGAIYGRGRPLPLFRGAASRVMLAFLPQAKAKKIYERHTDHPDVQSISANWEGFHSALKAIKRKGFYISVREVNSDRVGIAAPITLPKEGVVAVLSLILPEERLSLVNLDGIGEVVKAKSREISSQLQMLTGTGEVPIA